MHTHFFHFFPNFFVLESEILDKKLIFSNTSFVVLDFFSNYQKELGDQIWFISQIQKGVVSSFVVVVVVVVVVVIIVTNTIILL